MVAQSRPSGKDLLPNLRKLTYNARQQQSADALPTFLLFLGASIVELNLLEIVPMAIPDFLGHLAEKVPQLKDLYFDRAAKSDAGSIALASSLIRLEKLVVLDVEPIALTPAIWDAMAQHPCLTVLDIVAAKRPRMKQLRLVVDATAPIVSAPGIRCPKFETLEEFVVTLSIVARPARRSGSKTT
ncbi:hypothetical protein FRC01_012659 [Tulasnella sp. 417]|nr:hypothetical protein FRC01_012659 [Tulasnella sp. 417]